MTSLADQLRDAIAQSGQTIYAVAKGSGIADQVLRRFVNGERDLTLTTADKLMRFFGLKLASSKPSKGRTRRVEP